MTAPDAMDLEVLRRRVYSPDATPEDRVAYRTAAARPQPGVDAATAVGVEPAAAARTDGPLGTSGTVRAARRRRWKRVFVPAIAASVALVAIGGTALTDRPASAPRPASTIRAAPRHGPMMVGDAPPVPVVAASAVPVGSGGRATYLDQVRHGIVPDLDAWFAEHRDEEPAALKTATAEITFENAGRGPSAIAVTPPTTWHARTMTVVIVLDRNAVATWTASQSGRHSDGTVHLLAVVASIAEVRAGIPSVASAAVSASAPPVRLALHVPAAVRWTTAVTFSE